MQSTVELRAKRANLIHQARDLVNRADESGEPMGAESDAQYQKIMAEVAALKEKIEAIESAEQASDQRKEDLAKLEEEVERSRGRQIPAEHRSASTNSGGRVAYRNYCMHGETRGLVAGTDANGGYMILPVELSGQFIKTVDQLVPMRQLAKVFRIGNAKALGTPSVTKAADAAWTSEVSAPTADTTLATPSRRDLKPAKLSKLVKVSKQHMRLAAQSEDLVLEEIADAHARAEDNAFMNGDGSNDSPFGIFYANANSIPTSRDVNTGSATDFTGDGILTAIYLLKQRYRASKSMAFVTSDLGAGKLAKLKDGNDQYIWQPGLLNGEPDKIRGIQVYTSQYAPETFSDGEYVAVIGDFSQYWIAEHGELETQRLVELYAATGEVGFITDRWVTGAPVQPEAFVRLKCAA